MELPLKEFRKLYEGAHPPKSPVVDLLARAGAAAKVVEEFVPPAPGTPEHAAWVESSTQILGCPFCGGVPNLYDDVHEGHISCKCGAVLQRGDDERLLDLKKRWNGPSARLQQASAAYSRMLEDARHVVNRAEYGGNGFG